MDDNNIIDTKTIVVILEELLNDITDQKKFRVVDDDNNIIDTRNIVAILEELLNDITDQKKIRAIIDICNCFIHRNTSVEEGQYSITITIIKMICKTSLKYNLSECLEEINDLLLEFTDTDSYIGFIFNSIKVITDCKVE